MSLILEKLNSFFVIILRCDINGNMVVYTAEFYSIKGSNLILFQEKEGTYHLKTVRERFEWLFLLFNLNSDLWFADYIVKYDPVKYSINKGIDESRFG